jgi:hypothetical protein
MYSMVYIRWADAANPEHGWLTKEQFTEACTITDVETVGYLYEEDEHQVKVFQSHEGQEYNGGIAIPRSCIARMVILPDLETLSG